MNEALAISAANLNTIEKNLGSVADALTGVITDVSSVNQEVSKVESRVADLDNEIKGLVKEIRENTIVSNARQNIMYNNDIIEKKYGYYDQVRRMCEGLLDSLKNSTIRRSAVTNLKEKLLINNPNYWLSNALASLSSWILNDRENAELEMKNALKKDSIKASLFFSLVNIKLGRQEASTNWLKNYLNKLNPYDLSSEFIVVLDLVSNGAYGVNGKTIITSKISEWINILSKDSNVINNETYKWLDYITSYENNNVNLPYIQSFSKEANIIRTNLVISTSYVNVLNSLKDISTEKNDNKSVDEILNNLIYEYENKEKEFQKDNIKNKLIIECNGDISKAEELYKKQEDIYSNKVNLLSLLTNIVMFKNEYKISNETQKLALSLIKFNILGAYEIKNSYINDNDFSITVENFTSNLGKDINREKVDRELNTYIENEFKENDKLMFGLLSFINIVGMIGIISTLSLSNLWIAVLVIMLIGDIFLVYNMINQSLITKKSKKIKKESLKSTINLILAEFTDYKNKFNQNRENFEGLKKYLDSIDVSNYVKNNNGRDIVVGE